MTTIPTQADVLVYAEQHGIPEKTASEFWSYYNARGWRDGGGRPIATWCGALKSWVLRVLRAQRAVLRDGAYVPENAAVCRQYASERGYDPSDGEAFYRYYETRSWRVHDAPILCWRRVCDTFLAAHAGAAPPSVDDVLAFCRQHQIPDTEGREFYRFYSGRGWHVGSEDQRQPMRDWQGVMHQWHRRGVQIEGLERERVKRPTAADVPQVPEYPEWHPPEIADVNSEMVVQHMEEWIRWLE